MFIFRCVSHPVKFCDMVRGSRCAVGRARNERGGGFCKYESLCNERSVSVLL